MLPSWPPGGLTDLPVVFVPLLASLADLTFVAYLVVAEALVVFCTWSAVALEDFSRAQLLERTAEGAARTALEAQLEHTGAHELSVRLVRFLGSAMLVVGIAYLALHDHFTEVGSSKPGFPWAGVATAVGVTFLLNFVVNDVLVRLLAHRHPNRFLITALPYLEGLRRVTAPIRLPLVGITRLVFRVPLEEPESTAREEVLESVEEGEREGSLSPDEADMIESIIDLDRSTVEEICTPRGEIAMVHEDTHLDEAAKLMLEHGHRRVPVYGRDRDDVLGVVYALDLLAHVVRGRSDRSVRDVMRSPFFVPEGKPLNDLLDEMRGRRISLAIVLNEFGGTAGVVTMDDVLEEIVGEIEDEHDSEGPRVILEDGAAVVDGRTPIEDVNEALSISLPVHEDFETVGGLLFHQLGAVPQVGDRLTVEGVRLTVTEADARTVQQLRIRVPSARD